MKVVIVGGAGYVGSVVAARLAELDHEVVVLDQLIYGPGRSVGHLARIGATLETIDMRDAAMLRRHLADAGGVVHLGGFVGEPASALDPQLTVETNFSAPVLAAQVAAEAGVERFIFASTCSVYGVHEGTAVESDANPISLYAATKLHAEHAVLDRLAGAAHVFALRLATVFGVSPRMRLDSVVNKLSSRAARGLPLEVTGGGLWRPFVHVSDLADVVARLIKGDGDGVLEGAINIGSDALNLTIADVADTVAKVWPDTVVHTRQAVEDARSYRVGFDRLAAALPGACSTSLADGVRAVCDATAAGEFGDLDAALHDNYIGLRAALSERRLEALADRAMNDLAEEYVRRVGD